MTSVRVALIWATLVAAICVPIALAMTSDLLEGAGQALIYLSNGRLGWLPGLRPGVAQPFFT